MPALRRREHWTEVRCDDALFRQRDRDRAVCLEDPARVDDGDTDDRAIGPVAERVPFLRFVPVDRGARLADVEVEHVGVTVVVDPVELDARILTLMGTPFSGTP